ncbi:IclR family transcriptional regulator [Halobium palmae]|uniref:IclR family transcriptional regulator n=1 Tax=Halobium palmae TaxID=1776492 RepID=A0ABD5RYD3_9EURY
MGAEREGRRIQSVDTAFRILREIGNEGEITVSELADRVDLTPGTVHTHLHTLRRNGFVEKAEKRYKLGMEFIPFSERVRNQTALYHAGKEEVDKLAHKYDAVAHLVTEYDGKVLILHETFGKEAVGKQIHTDKRNQPRTHMHCTAAGKAILAHLPEGEVTKIVEEGELLAYTSHTITDRDELYEELSRIRSQRYAVNNEEVVHGNRGIGAPVLNEDEEVLGAISISGPASSWRDEQFEDELIQSVIRSANNAEINIHSDTRTL